jgi:acyl carrier protein
MDEKIYSKVKSLIVEKLGVDADKIAPQASFVDDLGADSLDLVELIMSLEEEFKVKISDEEAEQIKTVQQATEFIESHTA